MPEEDMVVGGLYIGQSFSEVMEMYGMPSGIEKQPVFLTKSGYGTMVIMSIESYAKLTDPTECALDLADKEAAVNPQRLTHEEVFSSIRRKIKG